MTLLVVLAMVQIYALYLYQPEPGPGVPYLDKVAHVLLFAVPAAVAARMRWRWALMILLLHALISEPIQSSLPVPRNADWVDLLADLLGIVVGMGIGRAVAKRALHEGRRPSPTTSHDPGGH